MKKIVKKLAESVRRLERLIYRNPLTLNQIAKKTRCARPAALRHVKAAKGVKQKLVRQGARGPLSRAFYRGSL